MYIYQAYPKWVHHKEHGSIIVQTEAEHVVLGSDWHHDKASALAMPDTSAAATSSETKPLSADDALESLPEEANEIQQKIDAARKRSGRKG